MTIRRNIAGLAVAVVIGGALTYGVGCGGSGGGLATTVIAEQRPLVQGSWGQRPIVSLLSPQPGPEQSDVVINGSGPVVDEGDRIQVEELALAWEGSRVIADTYATGALTEIVAGSGVLLGGIDSRLVGRRVGDRVVIVRPPPQPRGLPGLRQQDTVVAVVDILSRQ